jgi:uncharacterized phage protein (TIGR02220 family)
MAMGRNRTIRTEVHGNVAIASLPDVAWRVFFGLYPLVDDEGRTPADPAFIAGQVFWASPRGLDVVRDALATLAERALVRLDTVDDVSYLEIVGWRDFDSVTYQRIDKPQPAKFPAFESQHGSRNGSKNRSSNGSRSGSRRPAAGKGDCKLGMLPGGIGSEGSGEETQRQQGASKLAEKAVEEINRLAGVHYKPDSKATLDACTKLLAAGHTAEQIVSAIVHVATPWVNTQFHDKIRPATLLQGQRVRDAIEDIEAGNRRSASPQYLLAASEPWEWGNG